MVHFYHVLKENTLFGGFEEKDIGDVLKRLHAHIRYFAKNETIRISEECVTEIGIIVKGFVYLAKTDYEGKRTILAELTAGKSFGESLAVTRADNSPIEVVSATDSAIVFIPIERLREKYSNDFAFHIQMLKNMVKLLAERNMTLQIKNDILSQKTTREKLLLYFEYESKTAGSKTFKIHFSREELADFLALNSSAVSRELGRMRNEGLLTFSKNRFALKADAEDMHD